MMIEHKKTIHEILDRQSVHPFPARMAPGIALDIIASSKTPMKILDPMAGSGTVLAVARAHGHKAMGVDIDPLAVLLSRVWTSSLDPKELKAEADVVLKRARLLFAKLKSSDAYPKNADDETKEFVRYWFDSYTRRQLAALANAIQNVGNETHRDALWCGFSRLIITKKSGASLAMDLSHSRPHKVYDKAPIKPFDKFIDAVERVANNCVDEGSPVKGPKSTVKLGDARALPFKSGSIDLVLTSPPYLNAIDYIRCSKFSLVWMNCSIPVLREIRKKSVGAEVAQLMSEASPEVLKVLKNLKVEKKLKKRHLGMLIRYIEDMHKAIAEVSRVLTPKGKAVYVVGENSVQNIYIRNAQIISELAEISGLKLIEKRTRMLPANRRYMPPPKTGNKSASMDSRMRREVVLAFSCK